MTLNLFIPTPLSTAACAGLLTFSLAACEVGSKSVGSETEGTGDGSGDDGVDDGVDDGIDDGVDDGQTSSPTGSSGSDGGPGDGSGSDGSTGEACGTPPPFELAECVACDPSEGAFTNDACVTDCTGQPCGEPCLACPDEQPTCLSAEYVGACDSVGQCAVPSGPDQCMHALGRGFESELSQQGGCSDLNVYASDPGDTIGLILRVDDGLVAAAVEAGMPTSTEIDITDPAVQFRVETGVFVTELECNDVLSKRPVIDETWSATAGTLTIDLLPDGNGNALADITLTDVTIERTAPAGGAAPIEIASYAFTDVLVGWLPG
jgi:hypothetical protein